MPLERQVFWGQGAFLTPQHLQAQDAFHRDYALRLHRSFAPYHWGFASLVVDEAALGSGVARLDRFELLSRDGEWISGAAPGTPVPGVNAQVPDLDLAELTPSNSDPVRLYLVLKRERVLDGLARNGSNGRLPARHRLDGESRADPFDPAAPAADVDFLAYQARIVTSLDEGADALVRASEAYAFAEIVPNGPGRYKPSPDYIPPVTALSASGTLSRWTRALRDLLVSRGQDFAAVKRQRGIRSASTSAQEVMRVVMMQSFARQLPAFQEHVRTGSWGPYPLYQQLRRLVAEFSVFSEDVDYFGATRTDPDAALPDYDHEDLRRCFKPAFQLADQLIRTLTVGAEVGVTLVHDGALYKADLPPNLFASDKTRFYLSFESDQRGPELFAGLSRTGKICSVAEMPRLRQAALFGLKIDLLASPPEELPQKSPNTTWFQIDTRHPFWQGIRNAGSIAVFCDLPADATVIKLFPVGGEE